MNYKDLIQNNYNLCDNEVNSPLEYGSELLRIVPLEALYVPWYFVLESDVENAEFELVFIASFKLRRNHKYGFTL